MVELGDETPDFTVPKAGGGASNHVDRVTSSDALGEGPVGLVFVPAASD